MGLELFSIGLTANRILIKLHYESYSIHGKFEDSSSLCQLFSCRFPAFRQCSFGRLFVVGNTKIFNQSIMYDWSQANQSCRAHGGRLLPAPVSLQGASPAAFNGTYKQTEYWKCLDDFLGDFTAFFQQSLRFWAGTCKSGLTRTCDNFYAKSPGSTENRILPSIDTSQTIMTHFTLCQTGKQSGDTVHTDTECGQ